MNLWRLEPSQQGNISFSLHNETLQNSDVYLFISNIDLRFYIIYVIQTRKNRLENKNGKECNKCFAQFWMSIQFTTMHQALLNKHHIFLQRFASIIMNKGLYTMQQLFSLFYIYSKRETLYSNTWTNFRFLFIIQQVIIKQHINFVKIKSSAIRVWLQSNMLQKQPSRGALRKRYSENMQQRRIIMPKRDFSKVAFQLKFAAYFQNTFS